jgi:hypothetical protein
LIQENPSCRWKDNFAGSASLCFQNGFGKDMLPARLARSPLFGTKQMFRRESGNAACRRVLGGKN